MAWNPRNRLPVLSFLCICTFFFVIYGFVLAYLSLAGLGVLCPLCLASNLINLGILILLPFAMEIPFREIFATILRRFFLSPKSLSYCLITGLLFFGIGLVFARRLNPNARYAFGFEPEAYLKAFYDSPQKAITLRERPFRGNPDAGVTIIHISDFQCRSCRRAQSTLAPIFNQYGDRIRLIFLNYPFNFSCNPVVSSRQYPLTCLASEAALCANQQGKFWEYYDRLYQNQAGGSFSDLAGQLGMDPFSFEKCLNSKEIEKMLKQDIETALRLGVETIPVIYINGRRFTDWPDAARLRLVLDSELFRTAGAPESH